MKKRIGDFFLDQGFIDEPQLEEILKHSKEKNLRFGEAAMDLGLVSTDDMVELFGPDFRIDLFQLDPNYFPEATKDLFEKEDLIKLGFLPLGLKTVYRFFRAKRALNIGMIEPSSKESLEKIKALAEKKIDRFEEIKTYLILPEQFIRVFQKVYDFSDQKIRELPPKDVHERVQLFMETGNAGKETPPTQGQQT